MLNTVILADNIQKYRKARGLTQNELAQSLSISPQAISKWERGASVPDIENLCLMAERLEVSVDTLLGGSYATEKAMIAVDGGTSKTEFILFTEHGTLLHRLLLGGCNPNVIGIDGACQVLREGLDDLFKRHAFVCGVYIGASGFGTQDNARLIASQLQKVYPHIKLRCTSDIFNVIATATSSEQCLAAICGTGAVVFAKKGETLTRFGGWGYLFEEGRERLCHRQSRHMRRFTGRGRLGGEKPAHPAGTRQAGFHRLGFSPPALWGTSRFYRGFCAACLSGARPRRQPGGTYPGGTRRLPCPVDKPRVPYRARRRPAGAVREHFDQSDRFS